MGYARMNVQNHRQCNNVCIATSSLIKADLIVIQHRDRPAVISHCLLGSAMYFLVLCKVLPKTFLLRQ